MAETEFTDLGSVTIKAMGAKAALVEFDLEWPTVDNWVPFSAMAAGTLEQCERGVSFGAFRIETWLVERLE